MMEKRIPDMERLDRFMAAANAAYYATHDPFADFTTAPEISQVFGELLGLWAAVVWQQMGRPAPVLLAEAGPGRGTLMADALRAIGQVAGDFAAALRLHLVETSPRLRAEQAARLPGATWHERLADLPRGPLILLANEFLDALPIRQFVRRAGGWRERHVAAGTFIECPLTDPPFDLPDDLTEGAVMEVNEAARAAVAELAARLAQSGGVALFLDYGPDRSAAGDSFQAIRAGRPADPLLAPGSADLTAHVDFAALARRARDGGATVFGPLAQGIFLARLGLSERARRLTRGRTPEQAAALFAGVERLAAPDRMGRLFKALAIAHPSLSELPGFAT